MFNPGRPRNLRWSHRLYVRIYLAVLAGLAVVAILFGVTWHMNPDPAQVGQSLETFAEIASEILPPINASRDAQQAALTHWHSRMRADLALYAPNGDQIAAAGRELPRWEPSQTMSGWLGGRPPVFALKLPDGRWLVGKRTRLSHRSPIGLFTALGLIALAVGIGAYPIVRRLTRRLERLQASVDALGAGQLSTRVAVEGHDEVARLAECFNLSAARIEALVDAQRTLLANASHELRSPLARIRMAVELAHAALQPDMRDEVTRNIAELDQLIDEILLASRLDATTGSAIVNETVDLAALVAEECARVDAHFDVYPAAVHGDPKLLRRMIRNLLENAKRYGEGAPIRVSLGAAAADTVQLDICDGGSGIPAEERENIFAPFYRLPGKRERDGCVGLGLSLVRQIARKHGGDVTCLPRDGGGSCFRTTLPGQAAS
ncbi:MAG TPA: HAMP domain-containing sensor histidine kinase [Paucimonas sp.]|nr:HAMP domain-containing sensor histidine kinase [Paucimonas sp.]HJW54566.1 HAMP domain-containing sensor histidine kinase [Burkholderiaceae bacterium]